MFHWIKHSGPTSFEKMKTRNEMKISMLFLIFIFFLMKRERLFKMSTDVLFSAEKYASAIYFHINPNYAL